MTIGHATHCKFCKKPITIEIDREYDVLGDPLKLLPLACCNHCADVRVKRRNIEGALQRQCYAVQLLNSAGADVPAKAKRNIEGLAREYSDMVCDWNRTSKMDFDESIVEALMKKPQDWGDIIARLWKAHAAWKLNQSKIEARDVPHFA